MICFILYFLFGCTQNTCEVDTIINTTSSISESQNQNIPLQKFVLMLDYSGSMRQGYRKDKCEMEKNERQRFYDMEEYSKVVSQWVLASMKDHTNLPLDIVLFRKQRFHLDGEKGVIPYVPEGHAAFNQPTTKNTLINTIESIPRQNSAQHGPDLTFTNENFRSIIQDQPNGTILWLITDNIVDTTGLIEDEIKQQNDFYNTLRTHKRIQALVSYPFYQEKSSDWLCDASFMQYGVYISDERPTEAELNSLLGAKPNSVLYNENLKSVIKKEVGSKAHELTGIPIRLRPVEHGTIGLDISVGDCRDPRNPAQNSSISFETKQILCPFTLTVRNKLFHQKVLEAKLSLDKSNLLPDAQEGEGWAAPICSSDIQIGTLAAGGVFTSIDHVDIKDLAPQTDEKRELFLLAPNSIPKPTDFASFVQIAFHDSYQLNGVIQAELSGIKTTLAIDNNQFEEVYGIKQLPNMFKKAEQQEASVTQGNLHINIQNSMIFVALISIILVPVIIVVSLIQNKIKQNKLLEQHLSE